MIMKIDSILLLITVGLSGLVDDAGGVLSFLTGKKNPLKYVDVNKDDPLKFMEPYLKNAKSEFEKKFNNPQQCSGNFNDYDFTAWLSKGGTGEMVIGRVKGTINYRAINVMRKQKIVEYELVQEVLSEKRLLQLTNFPFIIQMKSCFKDNANLYFAMEYCPCGHLTLDLNEKAMQFYAAQIILALHYLHSMDFIYQDLKPENVLIGRDGYIRLSDFIYSTRAVGGKVANNHGGSVLYMAPELLNPQPQKYDKSVDIWALGALIYQIMYGKIPFGVKTDQKWEKAYQSILNTELKFGFRFTGTLKDLLTNLLKINPKERFGIDKIVKHAWFKDINWEQLYHKKLVSFKAQCRKPQALPMEAWKLQEALFLVHEKDLYPTEFTDF